MNEGGKFSRSVLVAVGVAVLFTAGAVSSYVRARQLRNDAEWLMARGNAEALEYANSFESAHADKQLKTFEERRVVMEKSGRFHSLQLFCTLAAVLSAFASYVLYLYWRLRQQLVDATDGGGGPHVTAAPSVAAVR